MKMTMKVDEAPRELDAALGQFTKATAKGVLRRVGRDALEPMADAARSLAPDDPETPDPDLESSITIGTRLNKRQASMAKRATGKSLRHGLHERNDPAGVQQEIRQREPRAAAVHATAFDQHARNIKLVAEGLGDEITKTAKRVAARAAKKAAQ